MNFTEKFVWFKLHLTRVWSVMNIPVQLFQLLLLILVSVKNTNQPTLYWLGFAAVFAVGCVLWYWDSKEKGTFEAETTYTMSKNVMLIDMDARLKRIEQTLMEKNNENVRLRVRRSKTGGGFRRGRKTRRRRGLGR